MSNLKNLVSNKLQWDALCEYIDTRIESERNTLEQTTEHAKMLQAQGAIRALKQLKHLRDGVLNETKVS